MAVEQIGIVGSGIMGSGVAEVAAKAGHTVVLRSRTQAGADGMIAGLEKSLAKQVERGKLDDDARTAVLGRVRGVTDLGERVVDRGGGTAGGRHAGGDPRLRAAARRLHAGPLLGLRLLLRAVLHEVHRRRG